MPGPHNTFTAARAPTPRCLRALAPFGVTVERGNAAAGKPRQPRTGDAIAAIGRLEPGGVALIAGPSGAGKSTLLRTISRSLGDDAIAVDGADPLASLEPGRLVADQFPGARAASIMPTLAAAGLGEARVLVRTPAELSQGERFRLALAAGAHRAGQTGARHLLIDECCAPLDRLTAMCVCAALRKWLARSGLRIIAAGAHEDLPKLLAPDLLMRPSTGGTRIDRSRSRTPLALRRKPAIEPGTIADFDALAHHHYRAGRPATWSAILRATDRTGALAGVLVASHPTLNAAWRERAWPGRYTPGPSPQSKRRCARRLNRELRCISRVVVEPRWRGLGVASELVRAYLDQRTAPATEAVAAMGAVSPFFEAAGMTPYRIGPTEADRRLLDALDEAGVPAWALIDKARALRVLRTGWVAGELERWRRDSGASASRLRTTEDVIARAAARLGAFACGGGHHAYAHA